MTEKKKLTIHGKKVPLSKPDKQLIPGGITKSDIVGYYRRIWPFAAPHVSDRPVVLQRFPDGIEEEGFYQKKVQEYYPDWIATIDVDVKANERKDRYVLCNNEETIAYLVNQGCITLHTWLSNKDDLEKPDRMAFDLDPSDNDFEKVRKAAFALKKYFDKAGIPSYPLVTGSKGLHVFIPLQPSLGFDDVRTIAREIAGRVAASDKELFTTQTTKEKRGNRVFIDYLRNAYGQTTVMPYSLRAREKAPVAVPLEWNEVQDKELQPQKYTMQNIFRRLSQKEDPWKNMHKKAVSHEKLSGLSET